jgi:hypothetical protein
MTPALVTDQKVKLAVANTFVKTNEEKIDLFASISHSIPKQYSSKCHDTTNNT